MSEPRYHLETIVLCMSYIPVQEQGVICKIRQEFCQTPGSLQKQPCHLPEETGVQLLAMTYMLRSNHLMQTVRTTFPVVQTVPITFPLGISHLHLWRSGDGFSVSVCTAGKKMASLIRKPCIIALQLQL